ncbi:ATP-binding protein [Streptomyces sp. H27-D2]|uniref:ATP-binding protein n=1 Tax=Streptomyces sp. H27-D2 TaxID=3046304 RepID=UPI002DB7AAE1|nr:ATP-binding protein [Streptomyces sp. H27-D2]
MSATVSATGGPTPDAPEPDRRVSVPAHGLPAFPAYGSARVTQCPPPPPDLGAPHPGNLAYSLTLPSAVATPAIALEAAELILDIHRMNDLIEPSLLLVCELVSYACRFTGAGEQIYLALRQREDTLRLTVYDTHPRHTHPLLAAACDERRRAALQLTPDLVQSHRGTWGFDAAHHPSTGTRTWATLVHASPWAA